MEGINKLSFLEEVWKMFSLSLMPNSMLELIIVFNVIESFEIRFL